MRRKKKKKKKLSDTAASTVVRDLHTMEIFVSDASNCVLVVSADVIFPRSALTAMRLKTFVRYASFISVSNLANSS